MRLTPRAKLLLLCSLFLVPIVASTIAYRTIEPGGASSNYGELVAPRPVTDEAFSRPDGGAFRFADLAGRWVIVLADSGDCTAACEAKLAAVRQVRLALGRNASRVVRVFVADDGASPAPSLRAPDAPLVVLARPGGTAGPARDRNHIHLVDPHGNVMLRWPATPDGKRMLRDLERLLKASQIG